MQIDVIKQRIGVYHIYLVTENASWVAVAVSEETIAKAIEEAKLIAKLLEEHNARDAATT